MTGLSSTPIVDPDILRIAGPIIGVVFFVAMLIAVFKIIRGPSILDRMMASDVLLATLMCGFGGYVAVTGRVDLLPVLLALSCLGFLGSVSVSRYVSRSETSAPVIGSSVFEEMDEADDEVAADSAIPRAARTAASTSAGGAASPTGGPDDGMVAAGAARDHHPGPAEDVAGPAVTGEEEPIRTLPEQRERSPEEGEARTAPEGAGPGQGQAPSEQEHPAAGPDEEDLVDAAVRDSAAKNADAEIGIEPSSAAPAADRAVAPTDEHSPVEHRATEHRATEHSVGPLFGDDEEEGRS